MRYPIFLSVVVCLGLMGCEPTLATRGAILDPEKVAEIKAGHSTREDVANILGTPTMTAAFDSRIWYYVGRRTEQVSFYDPTVTDQQGVEVTFDDDGVVKTVENLNLADAREVDPVDRRTPTYGSDTTLAQQILGNLARPIPKTNSR